MPPSSRQTDTSTGISARSHLISRPRRHVALLAAAHGSALVFFVEHVRETALGVLAHARIEEQLVHVGGRTEALVVQELQVGRELHVDRAAEAPAQDVRVVLTEHRRGTALPVAAALQPERHKVYQTRLAYYWQGVSPGQISIAYIQDEATNFIVSRNYTAEQFGVEMGGNKLQPEHVRGTVALLLIAGIDTTCNNWSADGDDHKAMRRCCKSLRPTKRLMQTYCKSDRRDGAQP